MPAPVRISKQRYNPAPTLALLAAGVQDTFAMPVRGNRVSIDLSWTGTPTGVLSLVCSHDGVNYRAVPGAAAGFPVQPAGGALAVVVNFVNVPGSTIKIRYTATSGTGTLSYVPVWA